MALVSRDPFSRSELHRSSSRAAMGEYCRWCGERSARGLLFSYRREYDGGRVVQIPGRYCSVACMRTYTEA